MGQHATTVLPEPSHGHIPAGMQMYTNAPLPYGTQGMTNNSMFMNVPANQQMPLSQEGTNVHIEHALGAHVATPQLEQQPPLHL